MKHIVKTMLLMVAIVTFTFSCSKKDDPATTNNNNNAKNGEVGIEVHNHAGSDDLVLGSEYMTASNQAITINKFNYYISNIKLKKDDGTEFAEEESYHLVQAEKASSTHFHIEDVPAGTYTSVTFMIGVDEVRNTSGAQTGDLDPQNGMFWTWTTGYIMAKMEGTSPQSGSVDHKVTLHIGGFQGENKTQRSVTITFMKPLVVNGGEESSIHLKADALKWFTPNNINFADTYDIAMPGPKAKMIADNYADMFSEMQ